MLPYTVPVASQLYVAAYEVVSVATQPVAAGAGVCTVSTPSVDPGVDYAWLVDNIVVQCTSSTETRLLMFIGPDGSTSAASLAAGSDSGNLDFDDVAGNGLLVRSLECVTFEWAGCSDGAVGTARMQYRRIRQAAS